VRKNEAALSSGLPLPTDVDAHGSTPPVSAAVVAPSAVIVYITCSATTIDVDFDSWPWLRRWRIHDDRGDRRWATIPLNDNRVATLRLRRWLYVDLLWLRVAPDCHSNENYCGQ
jgi:hypothetical protein